RRSSPRRPSCRSKTPSSRPASPRFSAICGRSALVRRGERGSAVPLLVLVVLATGGVIVLLGRIGGVAVDRASARTAADAAALAGAAEGRAAASSVAAANNGRIESYRELGSETEVRVDVGKATAV